MLLDFTSSLYLGFRHCRGALGNWRDFSTGKPAILHEPRLVRVLAADLARLSGCQDALLGRSTLHLFWDLFGLLASQPVTIFVDAAAYPIARWVLQGLAASGLPLFTFRHLDADGLDKAVRRRLRPGTRPVVVSDGYCPLCGGHAPLTRYRDAVCDAGGLLVIDDTQAMGLFGRSPRPGLPYGQGGGGSLRFCPAVHPQVITVTSLAKGFGVPLAFIGGQRRLLECLRTQGESRMHCSPPSSADLSALQHALRLNETVGDATRRRLLELVVYLRTGLLRLGLRPRGGLFPMQFVLFPDNTAQRVSRRLLVSGIHTINQKPCCGSGLTVTFIVTARHRPVDIDLLLERLAFALGTHARLQA